MNSLEALALSQAHELRRLLGDLCDLSQHGRGSCAEQAWNLMDAVIWYLDPDGTEEGMPVRRVSAGEDARDRSEICLMIEAGVSIPECARYFGASEAAVRQLIGASKEARR